MRFQSLLEMRLGWLSKPFKRRARGLGRYVEELKTPRDQARAYVQGVKESDIGLEKLTSELEDSIMQLSSLNEVSDEFRTVFTIKDMLDIIPQRLCEFFDFDRSILFLVDKENVRLEGKSSFGFYKKIWKTIRIPIDRKKCVLCKTLLEAEPCNIQDMDEYSKLPEYKVVRLLDTKAFAAVPLIRKSELMCWEYKSCNESDCPAFYNSDMHCWITGCIKCTDIKDTQENLKRCLNCDVFNVEGVLFVDNRFSKRPITDRDMQLLMTYSSTVALALASVRLYESLEEKVRERTMELERANEDLRVLDRMRSDLTLVTYHELRAPLSAIQGCLKVVLDGMTGEVGQKSRDMIARAERRAMALINMVSDLLDLSRVKVGQVAQQIEPLDLVNIIQQIVTLMRPRAEAKRILLEMRVAPDFPLVEADKDNMEKLFFNLISNAITYTLDDGKVAVEGREEGDWVLVEVSDTGIGISEDDKARIFDEFYRADSAKLMHKMGTGVGLSTVKHIVDAHRGRILLDSEEGKGSKFTVMLPKRHGRRGRG